MSHGPPRRLRFSFDGRPIEAPAGSTIAGALLAAGIRSFRKSRVAGQPRGLLCGIGTCFDCLVDVDGEQAVRACGTVLRGGEQVRTSRSLGGPVAASSAPIAHPGAVPAARAGAVDGVGGSATAVGDVLVIGAGPAGLAAAAAAASRGAAVLLADAGSRLGGQLHRQPFVDAGGAAPASPAGPALPSRLSRVAADPRVRLLLGTEIWSIARSAGVVTAYLEGGGAIHARAAVLATGASELLLPFDGWELPGVVSAGGAQALWKGQQVLVGRQVVVAGSGPFLLPVAAGLAEAGTRVAAVVEALPARRLAATARALAAHPGKLHEAAGYLAALARHRIPVLAGSAVVRCEGGQSVSRAVVARLDDDWRPVPGSCRTFPVDAVCVSYGFVPRLELARQLAVGERRRPDHPALAVACDGSMSTTVPGVFAAGELTGVAGGEVAELEGVRAGHAAADHLGLLDARSDAVRSVASRRLERARAFAARLERVYRLPPVLQAWTSDDTTLCRCEDVTTAQIRAAVASGATTAREVRSLTRCGMGYCQGRTCGPALQLVLAAWTGRGLDEVGDLQGRPVAVPVPLGRVAEGSRP